MRAQAEAHRTGSLEPGRLEETVLSLAVIGPEHLAEERELWPCRFLPYRYLNPYEATEVYTQEYDLQWRYWIERALGKTLQGPPLPLARRSDREVVALWRGRQVADALGMPYGLFIASGFQHMVQESGKKRLPRPNQLYDDEQVDRAIEVWSDPAERSAAYDEVVRNLPAGFRLPQRNGDLVQQSAVPVYVDYVAHHEYPVWCLAKLIGTALTESQARSLFREDLVDQAMERVRAREAVTAPIFRTQSLVPPCFGFAHDPANDICQKCPAFADCGRQLATALVKVRGRYGAENPRLEKRREADRLRQQAYRRRKKEAAVKTNADCHTEVASKKD